MSATASKREDLKREHLLKVGRINQEEEETERSSDSEDHSQSEGEDSGVSGSRDSPEQEFEMEKRHGCSKFCLHFKLLLVKNLLLFTRNLRITIFQAVAPIFFCLLIIFLQHVANGLAGKETPNPVVHDVGLLTPCSENDCATIGYGIIVCLNAT